MIAEAFLNSIFAEPFISVLLAAFRKTIRMTFPISAQNLNEPYAYRKKRQPARFAIGFLHCSIFSTRHDVVPVA